MLGKRSALFWLSPLLLALSCRGEVLIDLPVEEDTQSAIVGLSFPRGASRVEALDLPESSLSLDYDGREKVEVTALLYPTKSCAQMIAPGPLQTVEGGAALPRASSMMQMTIEGGAGVWREIEEPGEPLASLLVREDPSVCLACGCVFASASACDCDRAPPTPVPPVMPLAPTLPEQAWTPPPLGDPCEVGSARWLGSGACEPVGGPCPIDRWPEPIPGVVNVYVDPEAAPGGSGTIDDPLNVMSEAAVVAPQGAAIVLAKGMHPFSTLLFDGVRVLGACAAETVLIGDGGSIELQDAGLRSLRVEGGVVLARSDATAQLQGVVIDSDTPYGLYAADRSSVSASELAVHRSDYGLAIHIGTEAVLDRVSIEEVEVGIVVNGGSLVLTKGLLRNPAVGIDLLQATARLEHVVVDRTKTFAAIIAQQFSAIEANRVAVFGSQRECVAIGADSEATFTDLALEDCAGDGVFFFDARSSAHLERARIERTGNYAVSAAQPQSRLTAIDLTSIDSKGLLFEGTTATVTRALLERAEESAISSANSKLTLQDLTVRGGGLNFQRGGLTARRIASRGGLPFGLVVADVERAALEDVHISEAGDGAPFRVAVLVSLGSVAINRMQLERSAAGIYAAGSAIFSDLSIRATQGMPLVLQVGTLTLARVAIEGNSNGGVVVVDGATVVANDVEISGSGSEELETSLLDSSGDTTFTRFLLRGSSGYGARALRFDTLTLRSGEISGNRYGVGHPPGYDLTLLTQDVRFVDNVTHLSEL